MWLVNFIAVCFIVKVIVVSSNDDYKTRLRVLQEEFYQWQLKDSPEFSTEVGDGRYNDILKDLSILKLHARKEIVQKFLTKLKKIDRNKLKRDGQYSYDVFQDTLKTFLDNNKWQYYGSLNPLTALEGFQTDPGTFISITPFNTKGDFENYIARLTAFPHQIGDMIARFNEAITLGRTYHNVSIKTVPSQLSKLIVTDPQKSVYYTPFIHKLQNLSIEQGEINDFDLRGQQAIRNFIKSIQILKKFLIEKYIPNTRTTYGVDGWEDGVDYYKACLRWHLSTDMTPEEVHQKGLDEVKRIKEKITKIMRDKESFTGTLSQFYKIIQARSSVHLTSGEDLLKEYKNIIYNKIYPRLPTMFKDIPTQKVLVEAEAYNGPAGQYMIGTEDGSRPGVFQVNLLKPNETSTFNMMALTLHETVPGHHLQGSYALKAKLPGFQKNLQYEQYFAIPYHFPFYTAYIEGWALYAESLGEEMGLYGNYLDLIGRYGFEIFRACRLVVDTGIHYFKWSRQQSIQYMKDHSPIALSAIELEIDRYITWPGQACAYKIGELKIRELREKAKAALGTRFNVKDFHALILTHGPMPLSLMETIVHDWIKDQYSQIIG